MGKVAIIGAGPAGMMAAIAAAMNGDKAEIFEKNEKLGKKLFITGKGRCNITNSCDGETFFENIISNPKFMYSAYYGFSNFDIMDSLKQWGLKLKIERGERVFPYSDKSSDVIKTLSKRLNELNVKVNLYSEVKDIIIDGGQCLGIVLSDNRKIMADRVIVATGGKSYESTGSTGDGYKFALNAGHTVTKLFPALVPFEAKENWVRDLQGLSLKNVRVTIFDKNKKLYDGFGEMLFTHFGVSGPLILSASSYLTRQIEKNYLTLSIDLKPALSIKQLDDRILRDFEEFNNKQFKNALIHLFPSKLIPVIIALTGIYPDKKVNEISKAERSRLIEITKKFSMTLTKLRGFNEAIITQGGINVKEISPNSMESKLVKNLFFAGEVLDVDALTGGFNLQIAWSTGYMAGKGND